MDFTLRQNGRAGMEFMLAMMRATGPLRTQVKAEMDRAGISAETMPEDLDARIELVDEALRPSRAHKLQGLIGEWSADASGRSAHQAYREIKPEIEAELRDLTTRGPATLQLNPDLAAPDYWKGVWFHRTTGGWEDDPDQGFVHGELIHKVFVNPSYGGSIFQQRRDVMRELPRQDFRNIFEMGCGSGHSTLGLQHAFPDAQITACDLAAPMLEQSARVANENGHPWRLIQAAAEDTGLDGGQFDLVTSYIILHESPATAIRAYFREAFRLLQPNGWVLMADVPPYRALDRMTAWQYDSMSFYTGEPWWRQAASLDLAEVAREAGFVDAKSWGLSPPPYPYPWVTIARKPA